MMQYLERILECLITQELEREERRNQVVKEAEANITTLLKVTGVKALMDLKALDKRRDAKGNSLSAALVEHSMKAQRNKRPFKSKSNLNPILNQLAKIVMMTTEAAGMKAMANMKK